MYIYNSFRLGEKPIIFPQWSEQGNNILSDLMDGDVLRSFTDFKNSFNLQGQFFLFPNRTAMKTYSVPCVLPLPIHPLI